MPFRAIFYKSSGVQIWLQSLYKDVIGEADFQLYDNMDPRSWWNIWKVEIFHGANSMCLMQRLYFSCNIYDLIPHFIEWICRCSKTK
jgi:hypothetical protein